jgi:Na+-translocating ferredoxin:NAD+ oxidoreductase RnfC subunit
MTCGVVATSISGCDLCTACRVVCDCTQHGTQYTHHSLKYLLPQHRKSYNDVYLLINTTLL